MATICDRLLCRSKVGSIRYVRCVYSIFKFVLFSYLSLSLIPLTSLAQSHLQGTLRFCASIFSFPLSSFSFVPSFSFLVSSSLPPHLTQSHLQGTLRFCASIFSFPFSSFSFCSFLFLPCLLFTSSSSHSESPARDSENLCFHFSFPFSSFPFVPSFSPLYFPSFSSESSFAKPSPKVTLRGVSSYSLLHKSRHPSFPRWKTCAIRDNTDRN